MKSWQRPCGPTGLLIVLQRSLLLMLSPLVGVEAVLPLEIELPSLRVALSYKFTKDESAAGRT